MNIHKIHPSAPTGKPPNFTPLAETALEGNSSAETLEAMSIADLVLIHLAYRDASRAFMGVMNQPRCHTTSAYRWIDDEMDRCDIAADDIIDIIKARTPIDHTEKVARAEALVADALGRDDWNAIGRAWIDGCLTDNDLYGNAQRRTA